MAEVYWIHLPEHTDMFSEGYIGFTSKTTQERFTHHRFLSRRPPEKKYKNPGSAHLYAAIRKYGIENVIVDTILISDNEYCLDIERQLRPTRNIGWNIGVGGGTPWIGVKVPRELVERRAASAKKTFSDPLVKARHSEMLLQRYVDNPELRERVRQSTNTLWKDPLHRIHLSELQKKNYSDPLYKARMRTFIPEGSISAGMVPWANGTSDVVRWLLAEDYYQSWLDNSMCGTKLLAKIHSISNKSYFASLIKRFKGGWIPSEDDKYLSWKLDMEKENNVT